MQILLKINPSQTFVSKNGYTFAPSITKVPSSPNLFLFGPSLSYIRASIASLVMWGSASWIRGSDPAIYNFECSLTWAKTFANSSCFHIHDEKNKLIFTKMVTDSKQSNCDPFTRSLESW